jgi:hypothetical protein
MAAGCPSGGKWDVRSATMRDATCPEEEPDNQFRSATMRDATCPEEEPDNQFRSATMRDATCPEEEPDNQSEPNVSSSQS